MTDARPILFGKLPTHGDFIARGLDLAAVGAWDAWVSDGLEAARVALGERFDAEHERTPPWRFVDGPGPLGAAWRAGAMAPSIDAAGRRFMIVLAADGLSADEASAGEVLAEAMEGLIYDAFEQGWDADRVIQATGAPIAGVAASAAPPPRRRWWTLGGPDHGPAAVEGGPERVFEQIFAASQGAA
ncbi:MAG TPA: type VI secretion system-associated protein TagF [Caulobacteraceae bacterium]|nr:type VI secretion system-associated protein TagF [Caulobacteraceae bacterium]